jgi:glycosyltransferase involved in cell wall biosynthesis
MHVLLYSRPFFPATGGVETVSLTLAAKITAAGHRCTVLTETPAPEGEAPSFPFAVERRLGARARYELVKSADIVHSNGASMALFAYAKLARKPFVWTHQGYQLVSVDGLGWLDGQPAPLTPLASTLVYARKRGIGVGLAEGAKLGLRRAMGHFVDGNVAITKWVAKRQPLPRQVVIYNPFPLDRFKRAVPSPAKARFDFLFVGRLVTEKGVRTLLHALAELNGRAGRSPATLLLVGDGENRPELEGLAARLGIKDYVTFAGQKRDQALLDAIVEGKIAVVPSEWEEAMGGVALEILAAGLPLIVSERGGLAECVGGAAWTFPNGDAQALAAQMAALLDDEALRSSRAGLARDIVARFDETKLAAEYLAFYEKVLAERA